MVQVAILSYKAKALVAFDSKHPALDDAFPVANLQRGRVDFGTIAPNYGIIVYEFGLLEGDADAYYRLGKQLFNGNAILFKTDDKGENVNFPTAVIAHMNSCDEVEFFADIAAVEEAIAAGRVVRPQSSINGVVHWQWNKEGVR
jgi:hypothetical protein